MSRCQKKSSSGLYSAGKITRGRHIDHPAECYSIRPNQRPPPSPTIFMPYALPAATLPLYRGLGQAPNTLACIPSGVVRKHYYNKYKYAQCWLPLKMLAVLTLIALETTRHSRSLSEHGGYDILPKLDGGTTRMQKSNKAIVDYTSPTLCTPITPFPPIGNAAYHQHAGKGQATDIGNMHKKLVKIVRVVPEISSRTDRHRHTDPQTDILIIIVCNRSRGQSN